MRKYTLLVLMALSLLAAACAPAPVAVAVAEAVEVDIYSLPRDVGVDTVAALVERDDVLILDVREQHEYDAGHIPGVVLIPLGEVPSRLDEIPMDIPVIVTCRSGNRSNQAVTYLEQNGYDNVHNMLGGISEWQGRGYEVIVP